VSVGLQGPVLEKLWVFNFRVTFPERTTHLITPTAYHGLEKLPELVDTGIFATPPPNLTYQTLRLSL
jgi:hypothetical protein